MIRHRNESLKTQTERRGAVVVESALISILLFLTLMTMADLALGVLHYNSLSESARRLSRFVATSGELSEPERVAFGPDQILGSAADESTIAEELRRTLTVSDVENVSLEINWPDGANRVGDRVEVILTYSYQSLIPLLTAHDQLNYAARSVTTIRH